VKEAFEAAIREALANQAGLVEYVRILREHRAAGLTQRIADEVLSELRRTAPDEAADERIMEVMDVVFGFCAPHLRVWPDAYMR
jgi:hypothetical protein